MFKIFCTLSILLISSVWGGSSYEEWTKFKKHFIQSDGRIIDRSNGNITHTEGIGYAMFFAVSHNDADTFDKLDHWLESNLPKNTYGLYPWKWGFSKNEKWEIIDYNNATDGDLWIAFSRLKAAQIFKRPELKQRTLEHIKAIEQHLLYRSDNRLFLIPGQQGFITDQSLLLNPSYAIPFIFNAFAIATENPIWNELTQNSTEMLSYRFSEFQIHPDWLLYSLEKHSFELDPKRPLFSYDAIRIPLFWSIWYRFSSDGFVKKNLSGYSNLAKLSFSPIWINLIDNSMSLIPDTSQSMVSSISFFSIIFEYPFKQISKGCDEATITYFGCSVTLFSLLSIDAFRY